MKLTEILEYRFWDVGDFYLDLSKVLAVVLLFIAARFVQSLISKVLNRSKRLDTGRKHSLMLIIRYILWVIVLALMLEAIGIDVTILVAGSAALAVGIGFGLQQLANDLVSGVFLLFEGSVEVDDVLEVDGVVGRVREIRLRTTELLTRDDTVLIVPNHKFVSEKVLNWSHNYKNTRFAISIGVAYGSDIERVQELLLECANAHPRVSNSPEAIVNFVDFGDSALLMKLYIWTEDPFGIEQVKSDLRFSIDRAFKENGIAIPFPQRDLHFKSGSGDLPQMLSSKTKE